LKREQETYAANVRLIKNACADEPVLNVAHFMAMLAREEIAVILEHIESEKQRVRGLPKQPEQPSEPIPSAQVIPFPETAPQSKPVTDLPRRMKSMRIEITYPSDCGDILRELFRDLRKKHGITTKQIEEPSAEPVSEEYRYAY
jgi:hypothetical protein